jgi:hypothetical protein
MASAKYHDTYIVSWGMCITTLVVHIDVEITNTCTVRVICLIFYISFQNKVNNGTLCDSSLAFSLRVLNVNVYCICWLS